jgi:two-component system response regulator (stage 0 sporulation protein F)
MSEGDEMKDGPLKILIVDDQAGVRYLLKIIMEEAGHMVYTAQNGLEAVSSAAANRPDLIFMDVKMPLMGGLEALDRIKTQMSEIDVIIMTAYPSEDIVNQAKEMGALCCITKPFDVEIIKELLGKYRWGLENINNIAVFDYVC